MKEKKAIIIFVKQPELGKVKTRLASTTSNNFSLEFYKIIASHLFDEVEKLDSDIDKYLFYSNMKAVDKLKKWVNKDFFYSAQAGSDLGEKISNAFKQLFERNYDKVMILGSDIPGITKVFIESSFDVLSKTNVVIAPSEDGGYSLLGIDKFYPELFENIKWSTNLVLDQTKLIINSNGLCLSLLPVLNDIDTKSDLSKWLNSKKDLMLVEKIKFLAGKENIKL